MERQYLFINIENENPLLFSLNKKFETSYEYDGIDALSYKKLKKSNSLDTFKKDFLDFFSLYGKSIQPSYNFSYSNNFMMITVFLKNKTSFLISEIDKPFFEWLQKNFNLDMTLFNLNIKEAQDCISFFNIISTKEDKIDEN